MSVSAARRDHRSFCQYDVVYPIEHRTNLANAGTVHDGRFPHSDEVVWHQLLFQVCQGFPQQVTVAGGVYAGIVSRGFDPQNVGNGNKENPLLVLHHKAFQRAETTEGLEQWFETSICFPALVRGPGVREPVPWQIALYHTVSRDSQQRALRMHEWRAHREP